VRFVEGLLQDSYFSKVWHRSGRYSLTFFNLSIINKKRLCNFVPVSLAALRDFRIFNLKILSVY
jgi:hypothetical protein